MPRDYHDDGYDDYDDRAEPRRRTPDRRRKEHDDGYDEYDDDYDDQDDGYEENDGYDDEGYDDEGYDDDYDDRYEEGSRRAPQPRRTARAAAVAPSRGPPQDRQIYDRYRQSRSHYQSRPRRQAPRSQESHRAAVEAYRQRKARQGVASSTAPVRVAKRAAPRKDRGFYRKPKRRKDKWGIAKAIVLLVILMIIFLVPFAANVMPEVRDVLMSDLTEPSPRLLPESAEYNMDRVFTLTVSAGTVNYNLKVPVPKDTDGQEILEFVANPSGSISGTNMLWSGSSSGVMEITVSYHFKATTVKWAVTPETSGTTANIPAKYEKYLGDEWKIKPGNSDIKTLAAEIAGDKDTIYEKLKAMADWMRNNILYEKQRGWQPKDPLETLSDGTGDCDDQSMLFASLARSEGIPVWLEMGALYDQFQKAWGGHAWLRAYIPLVSGGGMEINMDPANKEFLVRDPWRITEWISDGNGDHLQNYYTLWSFSYSGQANYDADSRYVDLGYQRSSGTVSDKPPGSGTQAWKESWMIPGFEVLVLVPAMTMAAVLVRRRTMNA